MNHGVLQGFASVPKNTVQPVYGAGIVTDPRLMPRCVASNIGFKNNGSVVGLGTNSFPIDWVYSSFQNSMAAITIANLTGSGVVTHIKTSLPNTGQTITVWITIDDKQYTFVTPAGQSALFGSTLFQGSVESNNTATFGSNLLPKIGGPNDYGHVVLNQGWLQHPNTGYAVLPTILQIIELGLPRLRFEKNFKLVMQSSSVYSNGGVGYDLGGVGYLLD